MELQDKLKALKSNIKKMNQIVIAFSGGVDSTFLLKVAHDVLSSNVIAVTARSSTYPEREFNEAFGFARQLGVKQIVIISEELDIEGFSENPVNRCYLCKKGLFQRIRQVANHHGFHYIADGSNFDDLGDYRPGMQAADELGVISPLKDASMTKNDIRALSREMALPTWDKPAFACLSSRFPYGEKITKEKLIMVDNAEQYLLDLGFKLIRVRHHGDVARIEVSPAERKKLLDDQLVDRIYEEFKKIGFMYTALDLKGYRAGSMNEPILP